MQCVQKWFVRVIQNPNAWWTSPDESHSPRTSNIFDVISREDHSPVSLGDSGESVVCINFPKGPETAGFSVSGKLPRQQRKSYPEPMGFLIRNLVDAWYENAMNSCGGNSLQSTVILSLNTSPLDRTKFLYGFLPGHHGQFISVTCRLVDWPWRNIKA